MTADLSPPRMEIHPVERYFRNVWAILTGPGKFFRKMPLTGGLAAPLAFALITHWIGTSIGFLWRISIGRAVHSYWENVMRMGGNSAFDYTGRSAQLVEF